MARPCSSTRPAFYFFPSSSDTFQKGQQHLTFENKKKHYDRSLKCCSVEKEDKIGAGLVPIIAVPARGEEGWEGGGGGGGVQETNITWQAVPRAYFRQPLKWMISVVLQIPWRTGFLDNRFEQSFLDHLSIFAHELHVKNICLNVYTQNQHI